MFVFIGFLTTDHCREMNGSSYIIILSENISQVYLGCSKGREEKRTKPSLKQCNSLILCDQFVLNQIKEHTMPLNRMGCAIH